MAEPLAMHQQSSFKDQKGACAPPSSVVTSSAAAPSVDAPSVMPRVYQTVATSGIVCTSGFRQEILNIMSVESFESFLKGLDSPNAAMDEYQSLIAETENEDQVERLNEYLRTTYKWSHHTSSEEKMDFLQNLIKIADSKKIVERCTKMLNNEFFLLNGGNPKSPNLLERINKLEATVKQLEQNYEESRIEYVDLWADNIKQERLLRDLIEKLKTVRIPTCKTCEGSGKAKCRYCHGWWQFLTCENCNGDGNVECEDCVVRTAFDF